ncbi:hypothetical protein KSP39_PZI022592 [Platanthera zijinensis]|uniref:Uncharacterized protein n=1 Tax=Platanthera zijinensis TaxID=2320716 RepID=A0AAP0FV97_9ASPA
MEGPSVSSTPSDPPAPPTTTAIIWQDFDRRHMLYMDQHNAVCDSIQNTQERFSQELQQIHVSLAQSKQAQETFEKNQNQMQEANQALYKEFQSLKDDLQNFMRIMTPASIKDVSCPPAHIVPSTISSPPGFLGQPPARLPVLPSGTTEGLSRF